MTERSIDAIAADLGARSAPRGAIELHPEHHRNPIVRIQITPRTIDVAGWAEFHPFLMAWATAGACYVEVDGAAMPVATLRAVIDVRDLYGAHLVIVDETLAGDALAVLRPAKAEGRL